MKIFSVVLLALALTTVNADSAADTTTNEPTTSESPTELFVNFFEALGKEAMNEVEAGLHHNPSPSPSPATLRRRAAAAAANKAFGEWTDSSDGPTTDASAEPTTADRYPTPSSTTADATEDDSSTFAAQKLNDNQNASACAALPEHVNEALKNIGIGENWDVIYKVGNRLPLKYGDGLGTASQKELDVLLNLHINDSRVSCIVDCESEGLREALRQNETDGFIKCSYYKKVESCLAANCKIVDTYSKYVFRFTSEIVENNCGDHIPSIFNDSSVDCLEKYFKDKQLWCPKLLQGFINLEATQSDKEFCHVLQYEIVTGIFRDAEHFCGGSVDYALTYGRPLSLELAQFSEGRFLDKCPHFFK